MFDEYQVVRLRMDLPTDNLRTGERGTVLMIYPQRPNTPREYEVEFSDDEGTSLGVLTVAEDCLEAATPEA